MGSAPLLLVVTGRAASSVSVRVEAGLESVVFAGASVALRVFFSAVTLLVASTAGLSGTLSEDLEGVFGFVTFATVCEDKKKNTFMFTA